MTLKESTLEKCILLRKQLHNTPEFSGQEIKTKKTLMEFIRTNTSMEIHDCGKWFYAVHREKYAKRTLAFRGDFDGVSSDSGEAKHLCGHDGHSAILCGLALELEGEICGKNIVLIFQHGEETGEGAVSCASVITRENVEKIYGLHNIPGYPKGCILLKEGTFACASMGLEITFMGAPSHAAYPEAGKNPSYAIADLIKAMEIYEKPQSDKPMILCTVIGSRIGEKAFGVAASKGEVWMTIRSEREEDLDRLKEELKSLAEKNSEKYGLNYQIKEVDVFPETANDIKSLEIVEQCCQYYQWKSQRIYDPFRWSEDFGWYQKETDGIFLGLGSGENHPQLHTSKYEFPDEIMEKGILLWKSLSLERFI